MSDAEETQSTLPVDTTIAQSGPSLDRIREYAANFKRAAYEQSNAVLAPKKTSTIALPVLTESVQVGYQNKQPQPITCCNVGSLLLEKNTAYDFVLMCNAAAKQNITLRATSAFRTMEEQMRIAKERSNPAVAATKGQAAEPGKSNHQMGIAVDIDVKMRKADYVSGNFTKEFLWLRDNASKYGFDHVEGNRVKEPWHWTHKGNTVVGTAAFQAATGLTLAVLDPSSATGAGNQPGATLLVNLEVRDKTVGMSRGLDMSSTTRSQFQNALAGYSANQSNFVATMASQYEASKLSLDVQQPAFEFESLQPYVYNFETGLWGDGRPT